jgi:general stress protein 26
MRQRKFRRVTTIGLDDVSARVLQPFPPDPDLTVWFGTSTSSRKVAELGTDARAMVVYQDDSTAACVVLVGRMEVVEPFGLRSACLTQRDGV